MARNVWLLDIVALRHDYGRREPVRVRAPLPDLAVTGSAVPGGERVELDVVLEAVEGGITVRGTAMAPWAGECRRCLKPVAGTVEPEVDELFVAEVDNTDGQTYPIRHDSVDLEPVAREAIVLALPQAPLCAEDCRGLCPDCGVDRNASQCACDEQPRDPRWAALDALRSDTSTS